MDSNLYIHVFEWTPVDSIDYNPQALACGVGLYLGYLPYFPLWVGPPPGGGRLPRAGYSRPGGYWTSALHPT